jgi:hypothetical protein
MLCHVFGICPYCGFIYCSVIVIVAVHPIGGVLTNTFLSNMFYCPSLWFFYMTKALFFVPRISKPDHGFLIRK